MPTPSTGGPLRLAPVVIEPAGHVLGGDAPVWRPRGLECGDIHRRKSGVLLAPTDCDRIAEVAPERDCSCLYPRAAMLALLCLQRGDASAPRLSLVQLWRALDGVHQLLPPLFMACSQLVGVRPRPHWHVGGRSGRHRGCCRCSASGSHALGWSALYRIRAWQKCPFSLSFPLWFDRATRCLLCCSTAASNSGARRPVLPVLAGVVSDDAISQPLSRPAPEERSTNRR